MPNRERIRQVHGTPMTVKGVAKRFRKNRRAVEEAVYLARKRVGDARALEAVYDRYLARERSGLPDTGRYAGKAHRVLGRVITFAGAAVELGIPVDTLRQYTYRHRDAEGRPACLEAAYIHYKQVLAGNLRRRVGRKATAHTVDGRPMTVREAAAAAGCSMQAIYTQMHKYRISLEEAYHREDRLQRRKAELKIMRILEGNG